MPSYGERANLCHNPTAKRLLQLMETKQTNLAIAADMTRSEQILDLADQIGPEVCIFKTHVDIIEDFSKTFIEQLTSLAKQHDFLIFEDYKFADIGHTAKLQYTGGTFRIRDWADITNAHVVSGPGTIVGLKEAGLAKGNGLLLIAEMSAKGALMDEHYTQANINMALANKDFVIGFITQHRLLDDPCFIHCIPGINIQTSGDKLDQQYITPEQAILERGADIIIVGRGIYAANDAFSAAKTYRKIGWQAYQEHLISV